MRGEIRVLHVDDDPSVLKLTEKLLQLENDRFEFISKSTVAEAVDCLTGDTPRIDCIVSDYALPGETGVEFLETVRGRDPHLPFILFTGRGSESVASEALTSGATDYLQKQSGTEQYELLANRIENAVDQYWSELEQETSEQCRKELYRITTDPSMTEEEKVEKLLTLGCERLGVENGHIVEIDVEAGRHTVRTAAGSDLVKSDTVSDLEETYCRETISSGTIMTVYDAEEDGWGDDAAFQRLGIGCYIGGRLEVGGELFGTVCFVNAEPRERPFTEAERTFVDLVARWLNQLFERQAYERELESYEGLVEVLPLGFVRMTAAGEFLTANPAFVDMIGGETETDVLSRDVDELFDDPATSDRFIERLRDSGSVSGYETELTALDDTSVSVTLIGRLVETNGTQCFDVLVQERE